MRILISLILIFFCTFSTFATTDHGLFQNLSSIKVKKFQKMDSMLYVMSNEDTANFQPGALIDLSEQKFLNSIKEQSNVMAEKAGLKNFAIVDLQFHSGMMPYMTFELVMW